MIKRKQKPDLILLISAGLLIVFGFISLASSSSPLSIKLVGNTYYFLKHQLLFGLIPGLILGYACYKLNLKVLKKISFWILLLAIFASLAVFLPKIGSMVAGGKRWIKIFGLSVQPSEFLKLAFILYLSAWIYKFKEHKDKLKTILLPFLLILGLISLILYFQKDLGTLIVMLTIGTIIYFTANTPKSHIAIIIIIAIMGIVCLTLFEPYRINRLLVFLNPNSDLQGQGYHINQALFAVGSGGMFGKGLGMGEQRFGFIPEPHTDSTFAILAEETGFIGTFSVVALFMLILWRGIKIAKFQNNEFLKSVSIGITSWLIIQAFVNIGSMLGILPLTGIPLSLLSYGSSAFVCQLMALGLLLNISKKDSSNI